MTIINDSPLQVNKTIEITEVAPLSKTEAKVSKTAKGFFLRIGACIAAPFKFIARIMKSGFLALINLYKKENKNSPVDEKEKETQSKAVDKPEESADQIDISLAQAEEKGVQTEADVEEKAVVEYSPGSLNITRFVLVPLFFIWCLNRKIEQIKEGAQLHYSGYVVD
jgi:peptidyl-tRNA hydrolase